VRDVIRREASAAVVAAGPGTATKSIRKLTGWITKHGVKSIVSRPKRLRLLELEY